MLYPTMSNSQATAALAKLRENAEADISEEVTTAGDGDEVVDLSFAPGLADRLLKLAQTFGEDPSDQVGNRFEAEAAEVVHRGIPPLPAALLADPGFWRWLAVKHFRELVEWRHGSRRLGGAHPNNYGAGATKRNLLYRMYFRAEISLDAQAEEPYALSRVADKDLWESHLLAVRAGNIRLFVRAFLRFLYPQVEGKRSVDLDTLRVLASRLNRLRANRFFELMPDEASLTQIIAGEAGKTPEEVVRRRQGRAAAKAIKDQIVETVHA
jgi:hypothetical protein